MHPSDPPVWGARHNGDCESLSRLELYSAVFLLCSPRISCIKRRFDPSATTPLDDILAGLLKLVSQRRQLLDYVKARDEPRYKLLIERLGIRR